MEDAKKKLKDLKTVKEVLVDAFSLIAFQFKHMNKS